MAKPKKGKKIKRVGKLQLAGGAAKPGPELASFGINMGAFIQEFNAATADRRGDVVPTLITAFEDKSFTFVCKTTPAAVLLLKAAGIEKGASNAKLEKVATISKEEATKIAEYKMPDLNCNTIEAALKIIEGTARNMGIVIDGVTPSTMTEVTEDDIKASREKARKIAAAEAAADQAVADAEAARAAEAAAKEAAEAEKKLIMAKNTKNTKLAGKTKNQSKAITEISKQNTYSIEEAIKLVKKTSFAKFDATINLAYKLGLDPRQADQQIRSSLVLPHGTGKSKKVLVITKGDKVAEAEKAGADFVGGQELLDKIKNENWFGFDIIVASPDMMPVLGRFGRLLGPKGLMPNPKTGTVTPNVATAVENIKKGQVEYRLDKEANIHTVIGKVSFSEDKILDNFNAINNAIKAARPASAKGKYIQNLAISATMGPSIKINIE